MKRSILNILRRKPANNYKERLFGTLAPLVPDAEEMIDGPQSLEEFKANGDEFLTLYKALCGLRPDERMLDVGCGMGRKTLPLTQYLSDRAVYEGIDIRQAAIDWCRTKITPRFPAFHFQQIDVYNKFYNPQGRHQPSEYRFPFADDTFSLVVLGSVFTHMLSDSVENYLAEVQRVLRKGGRCLVTYFLLNEESLRHIEAGSSTLDFKHVFDNCRTISSDVLEQAIAFDERWIRNLYREKGLNVTRVDYGSWCGRDTYLSYQDLILAVKDG